MQRGERILVYGGVILAVALALGMRFPAGPAAIASAPVAAVLDEPPASRVAICDVYHVADVLLQSERYRPDLEAEQARLAAQIAPLEAQIVEMQQRGEKMDPQDPQTQQLALEYQQKLQEWQRMRGEIERQLAEYLAGKYVEAYDIARASADAVAEEMGYNVVIASRRLDQKIETLEVQQVIQAVLARPVIKAPKSADITEDVIKDLKL